MNKMKDTEMDRVYRNHDIDWKSINKYNETLTNCTKCSDSFYRTNRLVYDPSSVFVSVKNNSIIESGSTVNQYQYQGSFDPVTKKHVR